MLKHIKGNLLDLAENGEFDVVVHGANCFNTMNGGIAREIRTRYPHVAAIDAQTKPGDYTKLGNWTVGRATDDFVIINAYTQYGMSTGEDVFEYAAFELICQKLVHVYGHLRIGIPYIGMGLANGNKEIILDMIDGLALNIAERSGSLALVKFDK